MPLCSIWEADAGIRKQLLSQSASQYPKPQSLVDGALQVRIQTTFARFWQERLVSLVEPDAPLARHLLCSPHFMLQSMRRVEHEPLAPTDPSRLDAAMAHFDLPAALLERKISSLSNGELRRLLLARAYMEAPATMLLDDPLGGLDPEHRAQITRALGHIAAEGIYVVVASPDHEAPEARDPRGVYALPHAQTRCFGEPKVVLSDICVQFGESTILKDVSWTIRQGEHWLLSGPNGSGKSTLLSFLTADHPQIYRNQVTLLGKRPGQGLSVWEHKAQVGFCSPELHHQWSSQATLLETVCSGFLDPRDPHGIVLREHRNAATQVMQQLDLPLQAPFAECSYSQQRLALVARAFVHHPSLLLLDEPDQGLSEHARMHLFQFLDAWLAQTHSTLILATHHASHLPQCITHKLVL